MPILPAVSSSAMHGAVVPIAYAVITSNGSNPSFQNIPQGYQDLMIVTSGNTNATGISTTNDAWQINNDGSALYSSTWLYGNGATATSTKFTGSSFLDTGYVSSQGQLAIPGSQVVHILNYANTSSYKTVLSRSAADQNGSGYSSVVVSLYRSTSAVTRLDIYGNSGWTIGSIITLYGIRSVNQ